MTEPGGLVEAVLVCGGRWHDMEHARLELLTRLAAREHIRTRVFEDYRDVDAIRAADVLITYTCDVRPDAEQQQALIDHVAQGGRWLALHATNATIDPPTTSRGRFSTPDVMPRLSRVLGSRFLGHPPIEEYRVEVTRADHPLVDGVSPFTVTDELYVSELHDGLEVLLHVDFAGSSPAFDDADPPPQTRQPVLYLRGHGRGTVCYFTLGHCRGRFDLQDLGIEDLGVVDRGSWSSPAYRQVLDRCLEWVLTFPT